MHIDGTQQARYSAQMLELQAAESVKVTVKARQCRAIFYGERGKMCIGREIDCMVAR